VAEKYREALEHLGLSSVEADSYVLLLKEGQLNGNQLAEKLSIDRSVVYRVLRVLEKRGLIQSTNEKYNCRYFVDDVQKLQQIAEDWLDTAKDTQEAVNKFIASIPILSLEQVLKSKVRVFRGEDSIKKVYQEKNRSGDPVLREISNNLVFPCNELNENFWFNEIAVRKANKSFLHQLVDKSDDSEMFHRTNKEQFKEVRVFPSDFVMAAGVNLYQNKIAFHNNSVADPLAIIIEDRAIADLMKNFFYFVWNRSQVI